MGRSTGDHTLIGDYLELLGVPHTEKYSEDRFRSMPFPTMFGLMKLLQEYGVTSEGYHLNDKNEIDKIESPFLAKTAGGYAIVTGVGADAVTYCTQGVSETVPRAEFLGVWDGNVLLSYPATDSAEPDYKLHKRLDFFMQAKNWVLALGLLSLFVYAFVAHGLYHYPSVIFMALIDMGGLYATYLLVQKSLNIHNNTADRVCGVLQAGGCDDILATKASKFFGLFGWSEVGFSYFSVSLLTLLMFPSMLPSLALCNLCCLPFTLWSIWYQRFRAHRWCTLCVLVQCSLWLLFFCYCFGGWLGMAWPPTIHFLVLGVAYLCVMLAINALMPLIEIPDETNA